MTELDNLQWCGACDSQQQPSSGMTCIGCGMKTVGWATRTEPHPPRAKWNVHNGFPASTTRKAAKDSKTYRMMNDAFIKKNLRADARRNRNTTLGGSMSTQARFDPDQVEAFADKLKMYVRTLEDYDSQVTNALRRLGDTFDDDDYQDLCSEFAVAKRLLLRTIEAAEIEVPRIEAMCADVRANQAVRVGG